MRAGDTVFPLLNQATSQVQPCHTMPIRASSLWVEGASNQTKRFRLLSPLRQDVAAKLAPQMAAAASAAGTGSGRRHNKKKGLNLSLNTDTAKVCIIHC
jgi:hypothetical protein